MIEVRERNCSETNGSEQTSTAPISTAPATAEAPPLTESKGNIMARLRASGQWDQASLRKDQIIRELRAGGMKKAEAGELAWRRMAAKFLPLAAETTTSPAGPAIDSKSAARGKSSSGPSGAVTSSAGDPDSTTGPEPIPAEWGELPDSAAFDVEVEWVHQSLARVVEDRQSGPAILHWTRARSPAPSFGAVSLMQFAAGSRKDFFAMLARAKPSQGETQGAADGFDVGREKMAIEEIERLLKSVTIDKPCPHCGKMIQRSPKNRAVSG